MVCIPWLVYMRWESNGEFFFFLPMVPPHRALVNYCLVQMNGMWQTLAKWWIFQRNQLFSPSSPMHITGVWSQSSHSLKKNYKSSLLWANIKSWSARTARPGFGMVGGFGSESYYDHHQSLWVNILNTLWGWGFRIWEGYSWESYHDHHHSWSILWIDCLQVCSL
jgi:hypothetical protein